MSIKTESTSKSYPDITIFIASLGGGGAERVAVTLCNAFVEENKRVHLVVISKDGAYWSRLAPEVAVFHFPRDKMWKALLPLIGYLYTYRPPRLLCFMSEANVVGIIANMVACRPARVFISERAVFSFIKARQIGIRRIIYRLVPLLYLFAEKLICVSQGVADDLNQYLSLLKHKILVIRNPTIRKEIYRLKDEPVLHPWFMPGQLPVLLAVGGLRPEKKYDLLLHAFAATVKKHDVRLLILGDGTERQALEQKARDLNIAGYIDMPGFQENPYAYMAKAAAFVMCSETEGLPNALIEALVCGCPVIATDCSGGMREILGDSQYGVLVPTGDHKKLADAINNVLEYRNQALNQVNAFHKEKLCEFTPEFIIPQYLKTLNL